MSNRPPTRTAGVVFTDDQGRTYDPDELPARRGGQAEIVRARRADGAAVALKWFHSRETGRREIDELRRVMAADPLAGEWLALPSGQGEAAGRPFLVFDWAGGDLGQVSDGAPLPTRVRLLRDAATALRRFHLSAAELDGYRVHRDVKPSNFLVLDAGVRLSDLGAARGGKVGESQTRTAIWSPNYSPAEQRLPLKSPPRESWDVYGMSVTVFRVLTGSLPMAAVESDGLLNRDALRLMETLEAGQNPGTSAEEAEALASRESGSFLFLHDARAWYPEDERRLTEVLAAVAPEVRRRLTRALSKGLDPDPARRSSDLRDLLGALEALRVQVGGADPPRVVTPPPIHQPAAATPPRSGVSAIRLVVALGVGAGLGLGILGVLLLVMLGYTRA